MLKYRAISFPLLLALLAAIIYWPAGGPYLYALIVPLAFAAVVYEVCEMVGRLGVKSYPRLAAMAGGVLFFVLMLFNVLILFEKSEAAKVMAAVLPATIAVAGIGGWLILLFSRDRKAAIEKVLTSIGVLILTGFPLVLVALVYFNRNLPVGPVPLNIGARQLLFLILVTKAMDTGGYIFGKLSSYLPGGNHKICPSVSPKKSWEGTIGGMAMSVGVSLIFWHIYAEAPFCRLPMQNLGTSLSWYVAAGILLAIGSLAGDLTESALKRACDVKDSGHIIPGMGGVFDVMDSFIYNGVIFWVLGALRW
ncbi:phosphatidate cytidylyltransferase [Victivallis vadensis]|uniref:phosphatidate cytidylyltransferase n=1 Tax=Victivallis vadensis TaxID=172901 RepID=UPI003D03F04A